MVKRLGVARASVPLALVVSLLGLTACSWVGGAAPGSSTSASSATDMHIDAMISELRQMRLEEQQRLDQQQKQIEQQQREIQQQQALLQQQQKVLAGQSGGQAAQQQAPGAAPAATGGSAVASAAPPPASRSISDVFPAFQWWEPSDPKPVYDRYGADAPTRGGAD